MGAHTVSEKGCSIYLGGPDGESRAGLSVDEKRSGFYCCDMNGERRAGFGVSENGTAGLDFSSAQKDRDIHLQAGAEGDLLFMFSGNGVPMATLGLTEGEGREPFANLALVDKDGQAAAVVSGGHHSDPHLRLLDRRQNVRGSFGLGVGGEAQLIFSDAEGRPGREERAFERAVGERGPMYRVVLFITALVAGGAGGAWIGNAFSVMVEPLPAALITVVILASLAVALSVVYRLNL
jgi:hypothetical protein